MQENNKSNYGWFFTEVPVGDIESDTQSGEFFKEKDASEAIVREFIQNSLDARKNGEIVNVSIKIDKVKKSAIDFLFDNNFKKHMKSCGMEFPPDDEVEFIVLEDYGTTGLTGDIAPQAGKGNFYDFWWREGISEKGTKNRGKWGLGKITFFFASKIKSIFGITVREDREKLLMGRCLFKTHTFDGKRYKQYGTFSYDNYLPIKDDCIIKKIYDLLKISRTNDKSGFSVIIPYSLENINKEDIKVMSRFVCKFDLKNYLFF